MAKREVRLAYRGEARLLIEASNREVVGTVARRLVEEAVVFPWSVSDIPLAVEDAAGRFIGTCRKVQMLDGGCDSRDDINRGPGRWGEGASGCSGQLTGGGDGVKSALITLL